MDDPLYIAESFFCGIQHAKKTKKTHTQTNIKRSKTFPPPPPQKKKTTAESFPLLTPIANAIYSRQQLHKYKIDI